jgi:hypothetical protein
MILEGTTKLYNSAAGYVSGGVIKYPGFISQSSFGQKYPGFN